MAIEGDPMREQLQALLVDLNGYIAYGDTVGIGWVKTRIASILAANPEPVVRLRPGWVCKDREGLWWLEHKPVWYGESWGAQNCMSDTDWCDGESIVDPWPNHPNGGPECLMQVYP